MKRRLPFFSSAFRANGTERKLEEEDNRREKEEREGERSFINGEKKQGRRGRKNG